MEKQINVFSEILREMEAELGTNDMALLVFKAIENSIDSFKAKNNKDFCEQFKGLVKMISNTEPKFAILNYNLANLQKEFEAKIFGKNLSDKEWKRLAINKVERILKDGKARQRNLIKHSEKIDVQGKTILIHDHSHTVQDVLAHFKYLKKNFRVVIAEQDFDKTHSNIEKMHGSQIPFQVVPAYMMSHVHDQIDMAFFGAVTLKDSLHFVMDPGTHGTISELQIDDIPSYMFIDTNKFSLWQSQKRNTEVFIHKHKRVHHRKAIEYERIKYSHDRVPAKLFHKIVTNEGIFTPNQLKKFFGKST